MSQSHMLLYLASNRVTHYIGYSRQQSLSLQENNVSVMLLVVIVFVGELLSVNRWDLINIVTLVAYLH